MPEDFKVKYRSTRAIIDCTEVRCQMPNSMHLNGELFSNYSCAVRRMSYKMGSVSSFWCHICACKFMLAYIYLAIFRVGGGVGDYLKYSPVAAKILLLSSENVWKY